MARAILLVIDSLGCGGASDAAQFGDAGADTLGHIAQACAQGACNARGRTGALHIPALTALGLGAAAEQATGIVPAGLEAPPAPQALYGCAQEVSQGKDTPSGHWELAGAPAQFAFGYFTPGATALPPELVAQIIGEGGLPGILGDCHASGIAIIDDLGEEHLRSGKPILYTSTDSVLQIAAHEETFGRERLYELCRIVRRLVDPLHIGRVIARPFTGSDRTNFKRTSHRKDFSIPPPEGNVLDRAAEAGRHIISIGKIGDIFAHRNTGEEIKGDNDAHLFEHTLAALDRLRDGGLLFANYVDLDTDFGHRRNVSGYAAGLEALDEWLPALTRKLRDDDVLMISADHGNDPTWRGTDHTRECVPLLVFSPKQLGGSIGRRSSFADAGASLAHVLRLQPTAQGSSFL
jgi:phosphopentomutase